MNQKHNITVFIVYILLSGLVLSSCDGSRSFSPGPVPTVSQTQPPRTKVATATAAITETSAMNHKAVILTPDDVFSLPELEVLSTPDSEDYCEHLPSPQIVADPDRFSLISGRFVLCIYERTNTAMDLDSGNLLATNDERGDIVMQSGRWGTDEKPSYVIGSWNKAYLSNAFVLENYANHSGANNLSYEYCENMLRGQTGPSGMGVEQEKIACIRTTEGQIALIRVEKIYPAITLSVEFSFAILRNK